MQAIESLEIRAARFLGGPVSIRILIGDVREKLASLPDESVHCVVTSPPYWGLRDYGVDGQLGMEPTLGEHIDTMVSVFEEVRRVLRKDGTLWLNYGDCYATSPNGRSAADTKAAGNDDRTFRDKPFSTVGPILQVDERGKRAGRKKEAYRPDSGLAIGAGCFLKPKDLCMIPNRLAIALQDDGWWVRSEIVWHKPNPMPESVTDRPATAHEKIWLLTKSSRYWYDAEAVLQDASPNTHSRLAQDVEAQIGSDRANGGKKTNGPMKAVQRKRAKAGSGVKNNDSMDSALAIMPIQRNLRNVWTVPTKGFSEAHFATFPPDLIIPCIKAGCPEGGTVLDPFGGSGTTGMVADRLSRNAILIELNPAYAEMARKRIEADAGMFSTVEMPEAAE